MSRSINFEKEDFELLLNIINLTRNILEDYNSLYILEARGKKSSLEYMEMLESVCYNISLEESLYKKLDNKLKVVQDMVDYIYPYNIPWFVEELEIVKRDNFDELVKLRIVYKLSEIINKATFDELDDVCYSNKEDEYENFESLDDDEIDRDKKFKEELDLTDSIEKDLINTILAILNKVLKECSNVKHEKLLKFKYNISFVYEFVEEYLLKNFMEINSTLYIESKLTLDIQKRDTKELFDLLEDYMDDLISNQIDALIDVLTEECEENEKEFYIAITKIYLRMSLIFGTKKDFKGFIKCMKKELELM